MPQPTDPLQRPPAAGGPLFTSTSQIAGQRASLKAGGWRSRILDRLRERPSTLWELAAHFGVPDHTISGRLTELARDLWIEHAGERRNKPESGCPAEVWRVRSASAAAVPGPDLVLGLGYPDTLTIERELYNRQELLPSEGYPGIPYARRADTGGVRLLVRVGLIECPRCGKPLRLYPNIDGGLKFYRCGSQDCASIWRLRLVSEPGKAEMLALVMET